MKSALFFFVFFINAIGGIFFRSTTAFGFSILALSVSILFAVQAHVENRNHKKQSR